MATSRRNESAATHHGRFEAISRAAASAAATSRPSSTVSALSSSMMRLSRARSMPLRFHGQNLGDAGSDGKFLPGLRPGISDHFRLFRDRTVVLDEGMRIAVRILLALMVR